MSASQNASGGPRSVPTWYSRPIGQHGREIAGRAAIQQQRHDQPQRRLQQHHDPDHQPRPGADQFDDQRGETHERPECPDRADDRINPSPGLIERATRPRGNRRQMRRAISSVELASRPRSICSRHRCVIGLMLFAAPRRRARKSGGDARSARAGPAPPDAPARHSPCAARSRSPDNPAPARTSAGRANLGDDRGRRDREHQPVAADHGVAVAGVSSLSRPSTNTCFGISGSACTARASAHSEARRILSRSIRAGEAKATANDAVAQISSNSSSRRSARQPLGIVDALRESAWDRAPRRRPPPGRPADRARPRRSRPPARRRA